MSGHPPVAAMLPPKRGRGSVTGTDPLYIWVRFDCSFFNQEGVLNLYQDFAQLCTSLGPARAAKVALHLEAQYQPGSNRVRMITNPHCMRFRNKTLCQLPAADDIINGVARLDYGSDKGLSAERIFIVLQAAERISSELLACVLNVTDRQARRYLAAIKLAIFHLTRHYRGTEVTISRAPTLAEIRASQV